MRRLFKNRIFQLVLVLIVGVLMGTLLFRNDKTEDHDHSEENLQATEWTCSMHPQIRQKEPGKCPLCGMDLIPVSQKTAVSSNDPYVHTMTPEAVAMANIQTLKLSYVNPEHEIYLSGRIAVNEQNLSVISANFSGRIEKLYTDITGQMVTRGQKLASLYSPELITAQRELLEAAKSKGINPALYNAAKRKLQYWKISEDQIERIESTGNVISEMDVYSDKSGVVMKREISKGDYVEKGSVLFEVADLTKVWVLLDAYEGDLPWIREKMNMSFTALSVPGKTFNSTVTFISPLVDPQTRTIVVRAEASNPGMQLKPDMFVKGKITAKMSISGKALLLPKSAVLWTGKRSVVYVKTTDSNMVGYEMREVSLGAPAGDFYIIESGVKEGEEVVSNGVFAIDAAAQLSGKYSMMNRPEDKRVAVPGKFVSQLTTVTNKYFLLKNALVEDDFAKSKSKAGELQKALKSVDMNLLEGDNHTKWMDKEKVLSKAVEQLIKAKDIAEQRKHFETVSNHIIEAVEVFGADIDMVYVEFCPMAFDDKGAQWLSESEEVLNPYFGEEMLTCGEVKKKIRKAEPVSGGGRPGAHQH